MYAKNECFHNYVPKITVWFIFNEYCQMTHPFFGTTQSDTERAVKIYYGKKYSS